MTSSTLSWQGRVLTLDTRQSVEDLLKDVDPTTITEVHLGGNTFGVDASIAFSEWLAKAVNIKVADFADIFTRRLISEIPLALEALCGALIDKQHLVEVNLSDNAFGGRSVDPIVPLLSKNTNIQILRLNNNGLGPAGGTVIANALKASALLSKEQGKTSNLRTVICGRNRLENGSSQAWAEAYEAHGTLEEVRMPQNGIWMDGITNLARGLSKNSQLRHIDLQDNTFTHEGEESGVKVWADSLSSWPELHTLNLSDCVLTDGSNVPALLAKLATGSNPKLHTLSLQNNNLEAETFSVLAENIEENLKSLKRLELQWNDQEEDDEFLAAIKASMQKRGGKLIASEEDEEEDEAEQAQEEQVPAPTHAEAVEKAKESKEVTAAAKDAADELAELMSKVGISS